MCRVSIETVTTRAAGDCFSTRRTCNSFRKDRDKGKKKDFLTLLNLTLLIKSKVPFAHAIITSTARTSSVSPSS